MSELHDEAPEVFRARARSFETWLGSIRGYLREEEEDEQDEPVPAEDREGLVTVLANYCMGETAALEGAGGLIRTAPNRETKIFLSTQTVDEGRHLEVLTRRLAELGVEDVESEITLRANPFLLDFRERLLELVAAGSWESALFAQNVVLEAMEFAAFHHHAETADPRTRRMLEGIIKDERRHIGFGENELGRALRGNPLLHDRLARLKSELDYLVLGTFEHAMGELKTPASERQAVGRSYLGTFERLGFA